MQGIKIPQLKVVHKEIKEHRDLRELLRFAAERYGEKDAFIIKHRIRGKDPEYEHISFIRLQDDVNALGAGLLDMGLEGRHIAVMGKNSYEWMLTYFAVLNGIGTCVPLDKGLPYDEVENSLRKGDVDVLVYDPAVSGIVHELEKSGKTGTTLFIPMREQEGYLSLNKILERGRNLIAAGNHSYEALPIDREAPLLLMFTSGTTSSPKAVMLSHANLTYNTWATMSVEEFHEGDVNMAFLPYHHTYGSTGQCMCIERGITTVFCDGLKYIQKNLVEYGVSVFICVPLIIEAMYKKIMNGVEKQGKTREMEKGLRISGFLRKLHIDIRRRTFKEILDQLGGRIRFVISGASPLDPTVVDGFDRIGVTIVQGYGLTEASPVLTGENPSHLRSGSIGMAIPGTELMIAEPDKDGVGELMARGPGIMQGYYNDPEATEKAFRDGWFRTGDLASVDKDGYVFIRGRDKNVIVLKNGKNVYPEEIEVLIGRLPYVAEALVFGEPRHKDGNHKDLALCARVVYNKAYMKSVFGLDSESPGDEEKIRDVVKKDLNIINEKLPRYKHILRMEVTDEPMEKTTTGKVKRKQQHL